MWLCSWIRTSSGAELSNWCLHSSPSPPGLSSWLCYYHFCTAPLQRPPQWPLLGAVLEALELHRGSFKPRLHHWPAWGWAGIKLPGLTLPLRGAGSPAGPALEDLWNDPTRWRAACPGQNSCRPPLTGVSGLAIAFLRCPFHLSAPRCLLLEPVFLCPSCQLPAPLLPLPCLLLCHQLLHVTEALVHALPSWTSTAVS